MKSTAFVNLKQLPVAQNETQSRLSFLQITYKYDFQKTLDQTFPFGISNLCADVITAFIPIMNQTQAGLARIFKVPFIEFQNYK